MTASPLMQLTRVDGGKIIIVKAQVVSWARSMDRDGAQRIHFTNDQVQDVTESAEEISGLFIKGL